MRNSPLPCKPHSPFPSTNGNGTAPHLSDPTAAAMKTFGQDWIAAGEAEGASKQTLVARRFIVGKLAWFLDHQGRDLRHPRSPPLPRLRSEWTRV